MLRAAIIAILGAAAFGGTARAETFEAFYDVYLGGLRGGELRLSVERGPERYAAQATMRSTGLARLIFPGEAAAQAEGAAAAGALRPARFSSRNDFGDARQTVALDFDSVDGPRMQVDPPYRVRDYDADVAAMGDALDPVSAAVASLAPRPAAQACDRTVTVFDTRRRFDLDLGPATRDGDMLRCEGVYRRIAGFKAKHMRRPDYPFTTWWRVEDGLATLERASAPTAFGHAVARRRL